MNYNETGINHINKLQVRSDTIMKPKAVRKHSLHTDHFCMIIDFKTQLYAETYDSIH